MAEAEVSVETRNNPQENEYKSGQTSTIEEKAEVDRNFVEEMTIVSDAIAFSCAYIAIIGALVFSSGIGTISAHLQLEFVKDDIMDTLTQCFLYLSVIFSGSSTAVLGMLFFFFKMLPARGLHKNVRYFETITHKPRIIAMCIIMMSLGLLGIGGICFLIDIQGFSTATIVVMIVTGITWTFLLLFVIKFGATYIAITQRRSGVMNDAWYCRWMKRMACKLPPIEDVKTK